MGEGAERSALSVGFGAAWGDAGVCPESRLGEEEERRRDYALNPALGVGWDGDGGGGGEQKVCPES